MPMSHDLLTPTEHEAALLHSVAPALQRPPIEILDHFRTWLVGRPGAIRLASLDPETQAAAQFRRGSAQLVCTEPDGLGQAACG